jgi:hypothetical protein
MNRIQFFILTGLSSLIVLLLLGQVFLVYSLGSAQSKVNGAQAYVNQAIQFRNNRDALAQRIYNDSLKSNDAGLKDLVNRQHITPAQPATNSTETPATPTH